jgi:hypothetical protein
MTRRRPELLSGRACRSAGCFLEISRVDDAVDGCDVGDIEFIGLRPSSFFDREWSDPAAVIYIHPDSIPNLEFHRLVRSIH